VPLVWYNIYEGVITLVLETYVLTYAQYISFCHSQDYKTYAKYIFDESGQLLSEQCIHYYFYFYENITYAVSVQSEEIASTIISREGMNCAWCD